MILECCKIHFDRAVFRGVPGTPSEILTCRLAVGTPDYKAYLGI